MFRGYKFRLKPTASQAAQLRRAAGCCRFVWNWFRDQREAVYWGSERIISVGWKGQDAQLKHLKVFYPWLAEDSLSQALQQELRDLDAAYVAFFEGRAERPSLKRRDDGTSFRIPQGFERNGQAVKLPKIGWVRCNFSRSILGHVKNLTVSCDGDRWFISFATEVSAPADTKRERAEQDQAREIEAERLAVATQGAVGIDWGITQHLTLSTGEVLWLPRVSPRQQERIAILQRRISSKQAGSANRRKAVAKLARFHAKIRRRRLDALHKVTTALAKNHSLIAIEDLQVSNMSASARGTVEAPGSQVSQKAGLNRSILDLSPAMFRTLLTHKCEQYGCRLVMVPAHHTSQECPQCGHTSAANRLSQAVFVCQCCGHVANADVNAAINILRRATAIVALEEGHFLDCLPVPLSLHRGSAAETPFREAA